MQSIVCKKRARFALEKDYEVRFVPNRRDYNATERAEIWYQRQEFEEFRDEIQRIVSLMERKSNSRHGRYQRRAVVGGVDQIQEYTRGLECQTKQGSVAKKVATLDGICAVLMEQDHQQSIGCFSVQAIRRRYIEMNFVHVEAALKQGQNDADYENEADILKIIDDSDRRMVINKASRTIVNSRRNRSSITRLLFGVPQRSYS